MLSVDSKGPRYCTILLANHVSYCGGLIRALKHLSKGAHRGGGYSGKYTMNFLIRNLSVSKARRISTISSCLSIACASGVPNTGCSNEIQV
jgi:hypothetical protein